MIINLREKIKGQKGFTLVELMVVVAILGVLAAVAVPKFLNSTEKANTTRVAADLRTIDSAIAMYQSQNTGDPGNLAALVTAGYLATEPKPPAAGTKVFIDGAASATATTKAVYELSGTGSAMRAVLDTKTADHYYK